MFCSFLCLIIRAFVFYALCLFFIVTSFLGIKMNSLYMYDSDKNFYTPKLYRHIHLFISVYNNLRALIRDKL